MKPPCHNRPPRRPFYISQDGWTEDGRMNIVAVPNVFEDRCATHDGTGIGPNNENYPTAHGWDCTGCRWNPNKGNGDDNGTQ
jgi:hypothetical protein